MVCLIAWCYRRCLLYHWRTRRPSPISWSGSPGTLTPTTSSTEGWPRTVTAPLPAGRASTSLLVYMAVITTISPLSNIIKKNTLIGEIHAIWNGAAICGWTPFVSGCGRVMKILPLQYRPYSTKQLELIPVMLYQPSSSSRRISVNTQYGSVTCS